LGSPRIFWKILGPKDVSRIGAAGAGGPDMKRP
jgi:hypothetical protein